MKSFIATNAWDLRRQFGDNSIPFTKINIVCEDHRTPWAETPTIFLINSPVRHLCLDVPYAYGEDDGEALADLANLTHLEVNLLSLKDPLFFTALGYAPKLKSLKILLNSSFQQEFTDFNLFAISQLESLHIISSSLDMHALITFAAVCNKPINLKQMILEFQLDSTGSLKNKRHLILEGETVLFENELPNLSKEEQELRGNECDHRVFLDDPAKKLFPSLERVFFCKKFFFLHNTSQINNLSLGKMENKKQHRNNRTAPMKMHRSQNTSRAKKMMF
jgi:hypothetical protein